MRQLFPVTKIWDRHEKTEKEKALELYLVTGIFSGRDIDTKEVFWAHITFIILKIFSKWRGFFFFEKVISFI